MIMRVEERRREILKRRQKILARPRIEHQTQLPEISYPIILIENNTLQLFPSTSLHTDHLMHRAYLYLLSRTFVLKPKPE